LDDLEAVGGRKSPSPVELAMACITVLPYMAAVGV